MIDDAERPAPTAAERKRFFKALALVLGLTAFVWAGYGMARPHYHPHAGHPVFDAAYYVDWSDSILSEDDTDPRFRGAFYRAPLYPLLLSLLRGPIGVGLSAVVWLQMLAALAATGWLAHYAFRWAGPTAGIGTAVLLGAYHPWLFFSSWLLAECCALVLLVVALHWIARRGVGWTILAGVSAGLATLARPNLLLVVLGWAAWAAYRGDRGKALVLLFATAVTVLPVTVINGQRSGHFVPISANGGLTLYHGNGPGAEGVFRQAARISSNPSAQRQAATAAASRRSGLEMDAVDADRYWGRQAVRERLSAPLGTLVLVLKRLVLLLGTSEIALNETPAIDPNPWSRATFVPFAVLVALAAVAAVARRRHDVAAWSWIAIVACAATPLIFYVSSRYRLPFAVLLAVPAGVGLAELFALRKRAISVALVVFLLSLSAPWIVEHARRDSEQASPWWLAERARGYAQLAQASLNRASGASSQIQREHWNASARRFIEDGRRSDSVSPELLCIVARIAMDEGRTADAEVAWLAAWNVRTGSADSLVTAAVNLSAIWIDDGRASAAADLLSEALELAPLDENCWNNRIVALITAGRAAEARGAIQRAKSLGVPIHPDFDAALSGAGVAP